MLKKTGKVESKNPVFIFVTNRKETARVTHHILNGYSSIHELEDNENF